MFVSQNLWVCLMYPPCKEPIGRVWNVTGQTFSLSHPISPIRFVNASLASLRPPVANRYELLCFTKLFQKPGRSEVKNMLSTEKSLEVTLYVLLSKAKCQTILRKLSSSVARLESFPVYRLLLGLLKAFGISGFPVSSRLILSRTSHLFICEQSRLVKESIEN